MDAYAGDKNVYGRSCIRSLHGLGMYPTLTVNAEPMKNKKEEESRPPLNFVKRNDISSNLGP